MRKNQFGKKGSISYVKDRQVYRVFAPVSIYNLNESGKPVRKSLGCYKTKEEAQKVLSSYTLDPISYTLRNILDLWLDDRLKTTDKENTITTLHFAYNSICKLFTPILDEDIKTIHNKDISKILHNTCYSFSSLSLIKTYLNDAFNFALGNNWIDTNYISLIRLPKTKTPDKVCNTYTDKDIDTLFDALNNPNIPTNMIRYIKIMLVLLYTGLRKEELFKASFDTLRNIIFIKESKTHNGLRLVPVHHKIIQFIKGDFNLNTHRPHILDDITSKHLNYNFDLINSYFGFGKHTVHNCRKSFITRLISKGGNLPLVAKLVGHSTRSITVDIYTDPDIEDLRQLVYLLN